MKWSRARWIDPPSGPASMGFYRGAETGAIKKDWSGGGFFLGPAVGRPMHWPDSPRSSSVPCLGVLLLLILLLIAAPVLAAEGPGIVIEDAAGDVAVGDAPAGPAGDMYDLLEVRIAQETPDHLMLSIEVAAAPTSHDSIELAVVFQVDGAWHMGGYTALPYPGLPPHYKGGFACPATSDGFVDGTVSGDCIGIDGWRLEGTRYGVPVPLDFLNATDGSNITDAWAYTEVTPYLKGTARVDIAPPSDASLVIERPGGGPAVEDAADGKAAPSPWWPALLVLLGLAGMGARRRRT